MSTSAVSLLPSAYQDTFARDHLPPEDQWPVFLFDSPRVQYADLINATVELVDRHVQSGLGHKPALYGQNAQGDFTWSYATLHAKVNQIAHVLTQDMHLVSGNRVLLRGANSPMLAACFLAAMKAGLVVVPSMPMLRAVELKAIIDKAKIQAVLCADELSDEIKHCLNPDHPQYTPTLKQVFYFEGQTNPESLEHAMACHGTAFKAFATTRDDVCVIAFTSGTTGQPKGTMHFHRDILAMCDLFPHHVLNMAADDIVCGTPPLAFTFGLGGLLTFPLRYGAAAVLIKKYTPETLLETIQKYGATQCYTAPTFYRQMAALAPQYNLATLRHPVSAGEALPDATRQLWKQATGIELTDGIGGTEMIHIYIASAGQHVKAGSIGQVVPGYVAQVVDSDMNPVPPGQVGRLAVRGPTGCRYLDDARQTHYVQAGWNLPGDTFVMSQDGYFTYVSRNDDMIVSAGYNIASPEVEQALLAHPLVAECGVVGAPDAQRGQIVKAFVVLKPHVQGDEALVKTLQDFVKNTIAPFKYPRQIVFLESLPRTETGKLQRFKLRSSHYA